MLSCILAARVRLCLPLPHFNSALAGPQGCPPQEADCPSDCWLSGTISPTPPETKEQPAPSRSPPPLVPGFCLQDLPVSTSSSGIVSASSRVLLCILMGGRCSDGTLGLAAFTSIFGCNTSPSLHRRAGRVTLTQTGWGCWLAAPISRSDRDGLPLSPSPPPARDEPWEVEEAGAPHGLPFSPLATSLGGLQVSVRLESCLSGFAGMLSTWPTPVVLSRAWRYETQVEERLSLKLVLAGVLMLGEKSQRQRQVMSPRRFRGTWLSKSIQGISPGQEGHHQSPWGGCSCPEESPPLPSPLDPLCERGVERSAKRLRFSARLGERGSWNRTAGPQGSKRPARAAPSLPRVGRGQ